jgi:FlgN protein
MASLSKQLLEQEVEQLEHLRGLLRDERECLVRMDLQAVLRLAREKEALARRMRSLQAEKEGLEEEGTDGLRGVPVIHELLHTRNTLLQEVRELGRTQQEIIETQRGKISQLLGFLQNMKNHSATYDCKGKFK